MSKHREEHGKQEERNGGPDFEAGSCCAGGSEMAWPPKGSASMREMMQACPCKGWFARHRRRAFTAMAVAGLGFLILQIGWLLGVIAFFRTI